jgi:hypothetical protein
LFQPGSLVLAGRSHDRFPLLNKTQCGAALDRAGRPESWTGRGQSPPRDFNRARGAPYNSLPLYLSPLEQFPCHHPMVALALHGKIANREPVPSSSGYKISGLRGRVDGLSTS